MPNIVRLKNIEKYEFCNLDLDTGEKELWFEYNDYISWSGLYFMDETNFFALYVDKCQLMIYYDGKVYSLSKGLHISLVRNGEWRQFSIEEYGIQIKYHQSLYITDSPGTEEINVDLFYQIEQSYQKEDYYKYITRSNQFLP